MLPKHNITPAAKRSTSGLHGSFAAPWLLLAALLCGSGSGCQCCCLTEYYNDIPDCTSSLEPSFDCLYVSWLDLTRVNRVGGIQCGCYRCCPHYVQTPVYAHRWNSPPAETANPSGSQMGQQLQSVPGMQPMQAPEYVPGLLPETEPTPVPPAPGFDPFGVHPSEAAPPEPPPAATMLLVPPRPGPAVSPRPNLAPPVVPAIAEPLH